MSSISALLAQTTFTEQGVALMRTLAEGIRSGAHLVVAATAAVTQQVRDHLPSSPAKTGPLSDIHRLKFGETIASSIHSEPMVKAMRAAAAATTRSFSTGHGDQAFDATWLLSANMFGDTAVTIGNYAFAIDRTRDFVELSGYIKVEGFSFDIPTDTHWNVGVDIGAIAALMGAFTNVETEPYVNAHVQFVGAGADTQILACYGVVQDKNDAVPNELYFSGSQTDTGVVAGNSSVTADGATIRFTARFQVND